MTSERIKGQITFTCDGTSCHEFLEADSRDFGEAARELHAGGWTSRKHDDLGIWHHFCPGCSQRGKPNMGKLLP